MEAVGTRDGVTALILSLHMLRLMNLVWSGLVWSGLAWSGLVWSGLAWSGLVWSGLAWSGLVWSGVTGGRGVERLIAQHHGMVYWNRYVMITMVLRMHRVVCK